MAVSTTPITAGSGTNVAVESDSSFASGGLRQLFGLVNADTTRPLNDPDGTLQVSPEPTELLLDEFGAQAITVNWTVATSGGTTPSASNGNAVFPVGTTASATSYGATQGTFRARGGTFLLVAFNVQFETTALTNNTRWWGYGTNAGTPTATAPVTNGVVFLLDSADGALKAAVYSGGTRTVAQTLTNQISGATIAKPTDGAVHRFEIRYRQSRVFYIMDGLTVASIPFPNLTVGTLLNGIVGNANAATAPSSAPVFNVSSFSATDLGGNGRTVNDGARPWIAQTVLPGSTAATAAASASVVALHPSTPLPAGTNALGSVTVSGTAAVSLATNTPTLAAGTNRVGAADIGATTRTPYTLETTAAAIAVAIKASAGTLQELTLSNPTTTAAFVKLYNKASAPAPASDTPVATFRLAASGSAGDSLVLAFGPNGKTFSTGIAMGITAAAVKTDTAATVAGIQVSATYI